MTTGDVTSSETSIGDRQPGKAAPHLLGGLILLFAGILFAFIGTQIGRGGIVGILMMVGMLGGPLWIAFGLYRLARNLDHIARSR